MEIKMNIEIDKLVFEKDNKSSLSEIIYRLNIYGKQKTFFDTEQQIFPFGIITLRKNVKYHLTILTHLILDQQLKSFIMDNICELEKIHIDDIILS